jgi:hypothetical protein
MPPKTFNFSEITAVLGDRFLQNYKMGKLKCGLTKDIIGDR